uniref:ABC transporter domain-containing protein n=1 Tax=Caenorhabditis tropicalis TaxID=1561998 RepID=A0A1I7UTD8_9PELO
MNISKVAQQECGINLVLDEASSIKTSKEAELAIFELVHFHIGRCKNDKVLVRGLMLQEPELSEYIFRCVPEHPTVMMEETA